MKINNKTNIYWIWLQSALGPASIAPHTLLSYTSNDIKAIYDLSSEELESDSLELTSKQIKALSDKDISYAQKVIEWCKEKNVDIITYDSPAYPRRLRELYNAPIVLYTFGCRYNIDNMLCIAGVGTREMTKYGHDTAYSFSYDLARAGICIVSGMAAGIDTACHRGALDSGGKTIAVLGCRISKVYPAQNRDLMTEIARKGMIITEYDPFYHTMPKNFSQRNRIISGLCQGTVVFEADVGSGSLITADYALKQGRRLYSLPGKIGESGSLGTNDLIKNGATPVTRARDIIDEYAAVYSDIISSDRIYDYSPQQKLKKEKMLKSANQRLRKKKEAALEAAAKQEAESYSRVEQEKDLPYEDMDTSSLSFLEKELYDALDFTKPTNAELLLQGDVPFKDISATLTILEIKGYVKAHPGNCYTKKHK